MNDNCPPHTTPAATSVQSAAQIKRSTSCYKGSNWSRNGFSSGGPFSMYRICVLPRRLEGHLHAPPVGVFRSLLLYACDAQTRYVGWIITVKGFYLLTGSRKLGACQLLLFHSAAYHPYSQGQINTVWLRSRLQIIYSHTVWIYISGELVQKTLLVSSQHEGWQRHTISAESSLYIVQEKRW